MAGESQSAVEAVVILAQLAFLLGLVAWAAFRNEERL